MRYSKLIILSFFLSVSLLQAQEKNDVMDALRSINRNILSTPCSSGYGMIISNRAMNLFLSNKIGTYLSEPADLSLYKNSVIVNTADGWVAVSHNLYTANEKDERVRSLMTVGAKANTARQFGFTIKQTWIGSGRSYFGGCRPGDSSFSDKQFMDAQRASILQQLDIEITRRQAELETSLNNIPGSDIPGQQVAVMKMKMRAESALRLKAEFLQRFHEQQSAVLIEKNAYRLITANWTSIIVYVPLLSRNYRVLSSPASIAESRNSFDWELSVSHTRFFEGTRLGRLFLTAGAIVYQNNSAAANMLTKTALTGEYVGIFQRFITPAAKLQLTYIPPDWHFGLSAMVQQNTGTYRALDARLGLPVVLIDKQGDPAVNLEFQLRFADLNHRLLLTQRTSVAVTAGIPLSKIAF
jgi:hypothetical protein